MGDKPMSAEEYQQVMYERLGDRDYDCFENDEHELLKNKIGFANYGRPEQETGYGEKQKTQIDLIYEKIRQYNNKYSMWDNQIVISFIYNCLEPIPKSQKFYPTPVYVIRKCLGSNNPCRIIIDYDNRVYESWRDYISENKLPKGIMVVPKNGRYYADANGRVVLERLSSPSGEIIHDLVATVDVASTVLSLASGVVLVAASIPTGGALLAPVVVATAGNALTALGGYSVVRSLFNLNDRAVHGEDMSITNSAARGAYINIAAGTVGFAGAQATKALTRVVTNGAKVGQGARVAVNSLSAAALVTSAAGIGNSTYQIYDDWINEDQAPSFLTIVQLSSSVLFFGNAVYNFKTAGTMIEETQTNTLKKYQEALRSNNHRRVFDKLMKETMRQNGGDAQRAHSEVISTMKNMPNKDEMFAVLNRNNKLFNREGIRFSANNGEITLNGMRVDLLEFGGMARATRTQYLVDLPTIPRPTQPNSNFNLNTTIETVFNANFFLKNGKTYCNVVRDVTILLQNYSKLTQEKIMLLCKALIELKDFESILQIVRRLPAIYSMGIGGNPSVIILLVLTYLRLKAYQYKEKHDEDSSNQNEQESIDKLIERIVDFFVCDGVVDPTFLAELFSHIRNMVTQKLYEYCNEKEKDDRRKSTTAEKGKKIKCNRCDGHYFSY